MSIVRYQITLQKNSNNPKNKDADILFVASKQMSIYPKVNKTIAAIPSVLR